MTNYDLVASIVKNIRRETQLPERYQDLDQQTQERIKRQAEAADTTPESIWKVVLTQRAENLKDDAKSEEAQAIALASRR
ncbi:hypothetical protein M1D88_12590 [Arthrobacter sp. R1-13]